VHEADNVKRCREADRLCRRFLLLGMILSVYIIGSNRSLSQERRMRTTTLKEHVNFFSS
jgi:hypothetical protein